jgi:sulfur-oxidizing protein SoxY
MRISSRSKEAGMRTLLRIACMAAAAVMLGIASSASAEDRVAAKDPWPDLAHSIFKDRPLLDGSGLIAIDMPYRAEDAAIVPLTFRSTLPNGDARRLKAVTLVIDENPSPVAAVFTFGPKAGVSSISTRVRVDSYTNVHAVAELSDGNLYMVKTYVKAAGGCSAPAAKDASEARANLGEMRFRQFEQAAPTSAGAPREAQLMIRHPNNSGLQMDQITHLYVPAFFIDDLKIWQGDDLVLAMDGGISISENPSIRFTYTPNGTASFRAQAADIDKHVFKGEWPATGM